MFKSIINDKTVNSPYKVSQNILFNPFLTLFKVFIYLFGNFFKLLVRKF